MKLKVIFFGTPEFVIPVVEELQKNFELIGVVTAPDAIQGRKKLLTPSPVKAHVLKEYPQIHVMSPDKLNAAAKEELQQLHPDLFVVAAYGKIIPQSVLDIPRYGALNIHPSLLPKYRGTSPIQTMLLHGDTVSGVTIMQMDAEMDHGPIVSQWEMPISPNDTFASLHTTMFQDAANRLPNVIRGYIDGTLKPLPQDHERATFCEKITRESGYFDSTTPPVPAVIDRMTRAFYPWPTAWTKVHMQDGSWKIIKIFPQKMIQMEGKNPITLKEFANGYPGLKEVIEKIF